MVCGDASLTCAKEVVHQRRGISRFPRSIAARHVHSLPMLVPRELTNPPITIDLQLLTQDGQPVQDSRGAPIGIQGTNRSRLGRQESSRESPSIFP